MATVKPSEAPDPKSSDEPRDLSPADMLRIKQQIANQCFEMEVQLNAEKNKRSCTTSEAEGDLPDYISELEKVKTSYFNSTLALHRMQLWYGVGEKLKEADSDNNPLKKLSERCMAHCSHIKQLQQDSKKLQDEITEIQKNRLEIKRLTHVKIRLAEELASRNVEHPDMGKYQSALEKGRENLEKYKKMAIMTQNVLRGILLAYKVNWLDDPEVQATVMTLDKFPHF